MRRGGGGEGGSRVSKRREEKEKGSKEKGNKNSKRYRDSKGAAEGGRDHKETCPSLP